jgi:hydroxyethylthiazole kinase-like uncharacterized protein yjeF
MTEILSAAEMAEADRLTIAGGVPGIELMENAGRAVAEGAARQRASGSRVAVVAGPGNNGGDGFVAARLLAERGYRVEVLLVGEMARLKGDAALAAKKWSGRVSSAQPHGLNGADIVVDALFGAGLDRPVEGLARAMIDAMTAQPAPVVAVDLPSGINGTSGAVMGAAVKARATITFFRKKPAHLLIPGRLHCGEISVADIGIPENVLARIAPRTFENVPKLWRAHFPAPRYDGHKYDRGHALTVNAATNLAIMVRPVDDAGELTTFLSDRRLNAVALGPGLGVNEATSELVLAALDGERAVVLDADAITSFAGEPRRLVQALKNRQQQASVLTPHEGEFARYFGALDSKTKAGSKLERARLAAAISGAVVLIKGADTVVAAPDGRAAIAGNAPAFLATAGAGDVLTGITAGLLAQGMPAFEAASAAVWLHGEAAALFGPGLIAEDLPETLPRVYRALLG